MKTRVRAEIAGRVQGVGFRPTVYRYATELGLGGFVRNGPGGVTLEVEGDPTGIGRFFRRLTRQPPPQSIIGSIETELLCEKGYRGFDVVETGREGDVTVHPPPDLAPCDDCLRELMNPNDRRHGYPFINCTNCGPRFTIIRDLPYDRDKTSMAGFTMCAPCDHEYHDPSDRRFHAQPDACGHCGPRLELRTLDPTVVFPEPLREARELLKRGRIVAIKSLGGYHLACDATNADAIARLRERKHRPDKSFAVMFRDIETAMKHCRIDETEEAELLSPARPIVILPRVTGKNTAGSLPSSIAPDTDTIGAFLPCTPLHHLLAHACEALVMTSGNLTDEPIISDENGLLALLGPIADAALVHDRDIVHPCDDSVLRVVNGHRQFLRRARGFVPNSIPLAADAPHILAVGGELKNTFCLVRDGKAFVSQHIGDLKEFKAHQWFAREIEAWKQLLRVEPSVIAHDLHPDYLSTKLAGNHGAHTLCPVQHHHAHIASVLAEHGTHETVIGVALDGTGYGTDGTIWGGEFLVADRAQFERAAHFKTYPLPGGDKTVEQPWRMAASVLAVEGLIEDARGLASGEALDTVQRMIQTGFRSPLTSSAGRLFDAVAALLGLCDTIHYEAQAAIRLEAAADPLVDRSLPFDLRTATHPWVLDFGRTIRAIVEERRHGVPVPTIAAEFHNTVAAAVAMTCVALRAGNGLRTVALSGGVFQNQLLLLRTTEALVAHGFRALTNRLVPPNDGGLSLGQAAVAAAQHKLGACRAGRPDRDAKPCGHSRPLTPTGET